MSHVHCGRVFHVAGCPAVTDAAAALVSTPDGALVVDDGGAIVYCGERSSVPTEFGDAVVHDHRPGELHDSVRDRGVYVHTHLNENNRPGTGEVDVTKEVYGVDSYLDTRVDLRSNAFRTTDGNPGIIDRRGLCPGPQRDGELRRP